VRLKNHVAIVTGGASGIGYAITELFGREGADVVLVDWNREAGEAASQTFKSAGYSVRFCCADVSSEVDVEAVVKSTVAEFGRLTTLVNNAAVQILAKLTETTGEVWDRIHSVNLKGVFLCCKHALPELIAGGGGSIVNIGSVLGFVGDPDLAAYCAAKGGVIALTKATAISYGPQGVRVNCICPGDVDTKLFREYIEKDSNPQALRQEISSKYALRRVANTKDIAEAAVFLASAESAFITGSTLVVDGGLTVKCY
jgi:NAD(P)-dependent dehydrogenase (short-subunit alcohol dehydrogenase family)